MAKHGVSLCPSTRAGLWEQLHAIPNGQILPFGGKIISFRQESEDTVVTQMLRTQYICLVGGVAKMNMATVQPPSLILAKCAEGSVTQL